MKGGENVNDEELIKRVRNGDIDAFEEIIAKYEKRVFSLIYNVLKNENEIEDVAQEVFVKVYKNYLYILIVIIYNTHILFKGNLCERRYFYEWRNS